MKGKSNGFWWQHHWHDCSGKLNKRKTHKVYEERVFGHQQNVRPPYKAQEEEKREK